MPAKIPSTTCVTRSRMKFRRMREVYWIEASASVTKVIENVTPTMVIIEPAIVDNIPRAPSAPTPNRLGQRASHGSLPMESASIKATARAMLAATISEGTNQKLVRKLLQNRLNLVMAQPSMNSALSWLSLCGADYFLKSRCLTGQEQTHLCVSRKA
jgi:hypothetical protein